MKLYIGAGGVRPEGFKTIDIDESLNPDYVADIRDMSIIPTGSCSEINATAVLEHIEWPDGFKVIGEMARVLQVGGKMRICVPDMSLYARMLLSGDNSQHVMSIIFGVGGRQNIHLAHRYGYTPAMLVDIADVLGCGKFDWFSSYDVVDSSGGWTPRRWSADTFSNAHIAEAINFECIKLGEPPVPVDAIYQELQAQPMADLINVVGRLKPRLGIVHNETAVPALYQRIHFHHLENINTLRHTQSELANAQARLAEAHAEIVRLKGG